MKTPVQSIETPRSAAVVVRRRVPHFGASFAIAAVLFAVPTSVLSPQSAGADPQPAPSGSVAAYGCTNGNTATPPVEAECASQAIPVAGLSDIVAVDAGRFHGIALDSGGRVLAFGANGDGQRGSGTICTPVTSCPPAPQLVVDQAGQALTGVDAISAGAFHNLALVDGDVWAWGSDRCDELARGGRSSGGGILSRPFAAPVVGLPPDRQAVWIAAGGTTATAGPIDFSIAVLDDGTVWTWGSRFFATLGDGSGGLGAFESCSDYRGPRQAILPEQNVVSAAAGESHAVAVVDDGTVWQWGIRQNGVGRTVSQVPEPVVGLSNVKSVTADDDGTMALLTDNTVWGWGGHYIHPDAGPLDDDQLEVYGRPAPVAGLPADVVDVDMGSSHNVVLTASGEVWGWGSSASLATGSGRPTTPTRLASYGDKPVSAIGAGGNQTLMVVPDDAAVRSAVADFDGSGSTDVSVFRPGNGVWYVNDGAWTPWGAEGDIPVPGDYDGDGATDIAVFRPSTGLWAIHHSGGGPDAFVTYGISTDVPVVADYDGDGRADIAIFRPQYGTWWMRHSSTGTDVAVTFGIPSDVPVPADYDGDGRSDLGIFRDGIWYVMPALGGSYTATSYGTAGDIPAPGDYDGDNKADTAIFRPGNGAWAIHHSADNSDEALALGTSADIPVAGDYDGDGTTDAAVFHPPTGMWTAATGLSVQWGTGTDVPLPISPAVRRAMA